MASLHLKRYISFLFKSKKIFTVTRLLVTAVTAIAFLIILIGLFILTKGIKTDVSEQTKREALLTVESFKNHTLLLIQKVDIIINAVRMTYERNNSITQTATFIEGLPRDTTIVENIFITNKDGYFIYPQKGVPKKDNVSNRDYFIHHKNVARDDLFISAVEEGILSNNYRFRITRRLTDTNGSFAGVIITTIVPESFTKFYKHFQVGSNDAISLIGIHDGRLRARVPQPPASAWKKIISEPIESFKKNPFGKYKLLSPVDNTERYFYYDKVPKYPLLIAVGYSEPELNKHIYQKQRMIIFMALTLILVLMVVFIILLVLIETNQNLNVAVKKIETLSLKDELTGCYNRRFCDLQMKNEIARAKNFLQSFSVVICDIDFFKNINDNHGHPVGDEVLKQFAAILQSRIRSEIDHLIRYGGEEFLILLPQKNSRKAVAITEILRDSIESTPIIVKSEDGRTKDLVIHLTASFGVATKEYHRLKTISTEKKEKDEFIALADKMLYRAKSEGRNTFFAASLI